MEEKSWIWIRFKQMRIHVPHPAHMPSSFVLLFAKRDGLQGAWDEIWAFAHILSTKRDGQQGAWDGIWTFAHIN